VELFWAFDNLTAIALLDIFLVAVLFFALSFLFRGTQAVALLRGTIVVLVTILIISRVFQLLALRWLFENILTVLAVAIPVIFQPELRRALEQLGRAGIFGSPSATSDDVSRRVVDSICSAAERLSERRHGALIVLQRRISLEEYISTGIYLDSQVTTQLLLTIFWPKTDLHDGAAIIDAQGRLASAACVLPLTSSRNLPNKKMGTRHRAALGISETTDAICVVVSEETGRISITNGNTMMVKLDIGRLRAVLMAMYSAERAAAVPLWQQWSNMARTAVERMRTRHD
jgi:diadenylate cyclase